MNCRYSFLLLVAALTGPPAEAGPPGVAVFVHGTGGFDLSLSDLVAGEMSRSSEVAVVERADLAPIFREWNAFAADAREDSKRLGSLLGADYVVLCRVDAASEHVEFEMIAALSGEIVAVEKMDLPSVTALATQVRDRVERLVSERIHSAALASDAVAILTPSGRSSTLEGDPLRIAFLDKVRRQLRHLDVPLLHRAEAMERMLAEKVLHEKGWTTIGEMPTEFLGARYLVVPTISSDGDVEIVILDTRTGRRVAQEVFRADPEDASMAARAAVWIQARVTSGASDLFNTPPKGQKGTGGLDPETLQSFYRGIELYDAGRYLDAINSFHLAALQDSRLIEPYVWMERAYTASGFDEVAAAVKAFVRQRRGRWLGAGSAKLVSAQPGTNFTGVRADVAISKPLANSLSLLLVELLHTTTQSPVFLADDLARLRREYDVLVGLSSAQGVTWKRAPQLFFGTTVSAHLTRGVPTLPKQSSGLVGFRLEIRYTEQLDPERQTRHVVRLPADREKWRRTIAEVLARPPEAVTSMQLPEFAPGEPADQLADRLEVRFDAAKYFKYQLQDPSPSRFRDAWRASKRSDLWHFVDYGLMRWILRQLPPDAPLRPWYEFAFLCERHAPGNERVYPGVLHESPWTDHIAGLRDLAKRYPGHPVGRLARVNLCLYELGDPTRGIVDDDRMRAGRRALEALALELSDPSDIHSTPKGYASARNRVTTALRRWVAVLDFAFGNDRRSSDAPGFFGFVNAAWGGSGGPTVGIGSPWPTFDQGMPSDMAAPERRQEVRARLALLPLALRRLDPEPDALRRLTRAYPNANVLLAYALDFLSSMNTVLPARRVRWKQNDLLGLYEFLTHRTQEELRARPELCSSSEILHRIRTLMSPSVLFDWMANSERLAACRDELRAAVSAALESRGVGASGDRVILRVVEALDGWPPLPNARIESLLIARARDAWLRGTPHTWLEFAGWKRKRSSPRELGQLHLEHLEVLRTLLRARPKSPDGLKISSQVALDLFRAGFDADAEELYEEMLTWSIEAGQGQSEVALLHANAYLMLALIKKRSGDVPSALRWAQKALDAGGDAEFGLLYQTYGSRGWKQPLKPYALRLMRTLRHKPDAPMENPFENFQPGVRREDARQVAQAFSPVQSSTQEKTSASEAATETDDRGWTLVRAIGTSVAALMIVALIVGRRQAASAN